MTVSMFSREVKKMAQSLHSSTPSMTLPISCHICLGKVKQPVICSNHHVFCASCMAMWLKKTRQCPTCRVPITAENPCKEIIGGTNDDKSSDNRAMRQCLRKTRGGLLLREYEEDFEELMSENERLKSQKQSLEEQLKVALSSGSNNPVQQEDGDGVPSTAQNRRKNVATTTEASSQFQNELESLKEVCKMLRAQKLQLVQENVRLKFEVQSRSPKKFGRLTVAVLESKLEQCEHDRDNLRKALERSDGYIEELQRRLRILAMRCLDVEEASGKSKAGTETMTRRDKIRLMVQSLSDEEEEILCSCPEDEGSPSSGNLDLSSRPSAEGSEVGTDAAQDQSADSESSPCDTLPATPSGVFRTLTLRSPDDGAKMGACKPLPHQRKLDFNLTPEKRSNIFRAEVPYRYIPIFGQSPRADFMKLSTSTFWRSLQMPNFDMPGPSKQSSPRSATSDQGEAILNVAYEDKVSELDLIMRESENSASRAPRRLCFSHVFEPPIPADPYRTDIWQPLKLRKRKKFKKSRNVDATSKGKEAEDSSAEEGSSASGKKDGAEVPGCSKHAGPSQSEEMSLDLPSESMGEVKAGPSGSLSPARRHEDPATPPSSNCAPDEPGNISEEPDMNSQTSKRKSRSPFSPHGDTKQSKLD